MTMTTATTPAAPFTWASIRLRFATCWRQKVFWFILLHLLFYTVYPGLQLSLRGRAHEVPLIGLDALLPFVPEAAWVYVSLFIYLPVSFLGITDPAKLRRHGLEFLTIQLIAFAIFALYPTMTPRPDYHGAGLYGLIAAVDGTINALPSLHAALTVHAVLGTRRMWPRATHRALAAVWGLGIIWSAGLTHQHRALDLIAGVALGLAVCGASLLLRQRPRIAPAT